MAVGNYNPGETSLIVGGTIITGFADGTFIAVEHLDEGTKLVKGADDEGVFVTPSDSSGKITCTLMMTSDSNRILGALKISGAQVKTVVEDSLGYGTFAQDCRIAQHANKEYAAKDPSNRVWVILCPKLVDTYPTTFFPAT